MYRRGVGVSDVKCFNCGGVGHFADICSSPFNILYASSNRKGINNVDNNSGNFSVSVSDNSGVNNSGNSSDKNNNSNNNSVDVSSKLTAFSLEFGQGVSVGDVIQILVKDEKDLKSEIFMLKNEINYLKELLVKNNNSVSVNNSNKNSDNGISNNKKKIYVKKKNSNVYE